MSLSELIRGKIKDKQVATAILAIPATDSPNHKNVQTIAKIAAVAVASIDNTPSKNAIDDDRRYCIQCNNLTSSGLCLAAHRGDIVASRSYHPSEYVLRRCEGYLPKGDEIDQRTGKERWP